MPPQTHDTSVSSAIAARTVRREGGGSSRVASRHRSALPPGFDVEAWTREVCRRSGVALGVTDPVALAKLRVLTRRDP